MRKILTLAISLCTISLSAHTLTGVSLPIKGEVAAASAADEGGSEVSSSVTLFSTANAEFPYRIPAIAKTKGGRLVAVSDYRYCGGDIGFGRVDIHVRTSDDNGATWSIERPLVQGDGVPGSTKCGYGDAALVADCQSDTLVMMCVTGNTVYGWNTTTRQNPNRVARIYSPDGGLTWSEPEEVTEQIYSLFDESKIGAVQSLFFGSGRICQSRRVKVGNHYRLYAALCARPGGNRVVYSDDLGRTWHSLGSIDVSPAPKGDEPKCEELPDGRVILSSRAWGGRHFNVFTYTRKPSRKHPADGQWGDAVSTQDFNGGIVAKENACNGEILILPARTAKGRKVTLALHSVPLGPGRTNVGIYYRELAAPLGCQRCLSAGWTLGLQVSHKQSAYSTMIQQADGRIAFFWEEESTKGGGYEMEYRPLTLEEITNGQYK